MKNGALSEIEAAAVFDVARVDGRQNLTAGRMTLHGACSVSTKLPGVTHSDHSATDYLDTNHYNIYAYNGCPTRDSTHGEY
jgi:hypothetical protein